MARNKIGITERTIPEWLQCAKLRTEKKQLESSKRQAEISATKYKNRFESVSTQSEKEKASWRNKEIELKARLHSEESRVKQLQHNIQVFAHERDKVLNEVREVRQQKLQISSAYQSLLRKSVNGNTTNENPGYGGQNSVPNGSIDGPKTQVLSQSSYEKNQVFLSLNDMNESISSDILQLKEELARLRSIGSKIDESDNDKGL